MPMTLPTCAILCGGLGTRLAPLTDNTPKSLVEVAGKPFLFHQLELLLSKGVTDVVLCIGHYGGYIVHKVDTYFKHSMNIRFSYDGPDRIGTAGAIRKALPMLGDEFFILYGDSYLDTDYRRIAESFQVFQQPAMMVVKKNLSDRHQNNAMFVEGKFRYYDMIPGAHFDHIDYGVSMMRRSTMPDVVWGFQELPRVFFWLSKRNLLGAFTTYDPMLGIGNHESLAEMQAFMERQKA